MQNVKLGEAFPGWNALLCSHFLFLGLSLVSLLIPLRVISLQIFLPPQKLSLSGLPTHGRFPTRGGRRGTVHGVLPAREPQRASSPRFARKWRTQARSMTARVQPIPRIPPVASAQSPPQQPPPPPRAELTPRPPGRGENGRVAPPPPLGCPRVPRICPLGTGAGGRGRRRRRPGPGSGQPRARGSLLGRRARLPGAPNPTAPRPGPGLQLRLPPPPASSPAFLNH